MNIHSKGSYVSTNTKWVSYVRPALTFSNVLDQINRILSVSSTAIDMQQRNSDGQEISARESDDPHQLSSLLHVNAGVMHQADKTSRQVATNPWKEKLAFYRRQLALRTRQFKESEKIAIELSNKVELLVQERAYMKREHMKALSFSINKINMLKEANDIGTFRRQKAVLTRKNEKSEKKIANIRKEMTLLRRRLTEKNEVIEKLKSVHKEGPRLMRRGETYDELIDFATGTSRKIYLDGDPIDLD